MGEAPWLARGRGRTCRPRKGVSATEYHRSHRRPRRDEGGITTPPTGARDDFVHPMLAMAAVTTAMTVAAIATVKATNDVAAAAAAAMAAAAAIDRPHAIAVAGRWDHASLRRPGKREEERVKG